MKKVKIGGGDATSGLTEHDHSRHRRKAYYHGKYNREVMLTVLFLILWMFLSRMG